MENFQKKTLKTKRSLTYTYYVSNGAENPRLPALLFVHGFPDSAHLWDGVVSYLDKLPNKVILPDCLGYGGTDKPVDASLYAYKDQAADFVDILRNEDAKSTIIIGHDWGSALVQRIYLHYRHLFSGVVLLNTGYMVPSDQKFDLAAVNEMTTKALGYPQFAYWEFFTAPDAAEIIDAHMEKMWQILHGDVDEWMKKMFCVPGAMRSFLLGDEDVPLHEYAAQRGWKESFMAQFKENGFAPALQMYKATASNIQAESDATIPKDRLTFEVPLLFVLCSKDAVCVPEMMAQAKQEGLVPYLKEVHMDAAHWSPMEKPKEIAGLIEEFANEISK